MRRRTVPSSSNTTGPNISFGDEDVDESKRRFKATTTTSTSNNSSTTTMETKTNEGVIRVSVPSLLLAVIPLLCIAAVCYHLGLISISSSIATGCLRTFVQLSLLGTMLRPIFMWKKIWLVIGYALFMITLAAYESSSRTKYVFEGQFSYIFFSLALNVGMVGLLAFVIIIKPKPVWNPRYVIPIVGMLLGNSLNGVSLSLNSITTALVEQQGEIELYLSFGASKYEAVSRLLMEAIKTGATPILNTMRVIGIISIPGMMTGQILGGSPAMVAARYQMLIIYLIAISTLGVILCNCWLALEIGFDAHHILQTERFVLSTRPSVIQAIMTAMYVISTGGSLTSTPSTSSLLNTMQQQGTRLPEIHPKDELVIETLQYACPERKFDNDSRKGKKLEVANARRSFVTYVVVGNDEEQDHGMGSVTNTKGDDDAPMPVAASSSSSSSSSSSVSFQRQILFEKVSLTVGPEDIISIGGPSGVGKSTLLRIIAGLSPMDDYDNDDDVDDTDASGRSIQFDGQNWYHHHEQRRHSISSTDASAWRQKIRYVTQSKVDIPGTPSNFIETFTSFRSWKRASKPSPEQVKENAIKYISEWGLKKGDMDKEWSKLSGGEAQRMIVALALASDPDILLFDESTSALDLKTKIAVEDAILRYVHDEQVGIVWISHDENQSKRIKESNVLRCE